MKKKLSKREVMARIEDEKRKSLSGNLYSFALIACAVVTVICRSESLCSGWFYLWLWVGFVVFSAMVFCAVPYFMGLTGYQPTKHDARKFFGEALRRDLRFTNHPLEEVEEDFKHYLWILQNWDHL